MKRTWLAIVTLLCCTGCPVGGSAVGPVGPGDALPNIAAGGRVLIANNLGETLSELDLTTSPPVLRNDIALVGQSPNALVLHEDTVVVVNSLSNSLQLLDARTLVTQAEHSTGARTNPWDLAIDPAGVAWTTCWVSNDLRGIDLASGDIVATIPAPAGPGRAHPQGIVRDPVSGSLAIALPMLDGLFMPQGPGVIWWLDAVEGGYLDAGTLAIEGTTYASDVELSAIGGRSAVVAACSGAFEPGSGYLENGALAWIDMRARTVREVIPVDSAPVVVIARGGQAWSAGAQSGDVVRVVFGLDEPAPIRITLPDSGTGLNYTSALGFADDQTVLAVQFNADRLYAIDTESLAVSGGATVGDGPVALLVLPRGE